MSIESVTRYVLLYCHFKEIPITPLKLQKLLYYIQSWHLVFFEGENIFEELPEAWLNGPVYPKVYGAYYHQNGVSRNEQIMINGTYEDLVDQMVSLRIKFKNKIELLETVLEKYANLSPEKLVILTHSESPWLNARKKCENLKCKVKLSLDDMKNYYLQKLENY